MNNSPESESFNNRILVIDDNPAIHQDFRKILSPIDSALRESWMRMRLRFSERRPMLVAS